VNAAVGESAVILALAGAVVGFVTLVVGLVRRRENLLQAGRTYTWLIVLGAVIATVAMQHALITRDFSLRYVADNDSLTTPLLFRVTAMWSDLAGSILLWGLVLAGYLGAVAVHFRRRISDPLVGWATAIGYGVAAFFFGLMASVSNPFARVHGPIPTNGRARTRCCRTTSWWHSIPRCSTWGWSASPSLSPSPAQASSPGGWARDG